MTKLPHMPLWVYDIDTDTECSLMSSAEFGIYIRMLVKQWINEHLPSEIRDIAKLLRERPRAIADWMSQYQSKLPLCEDGNRRNPRLAAERENVVAKVEMLRDRNRANGKRGGRPKKVETETQEKPTGFIRAFDSDFNSVSCSVREGESEREKPPQAVLHRADPVEVEAVMQAIPPDRQRKPVLLRSSIQWALLRLQDRKHPDAANWLAGRIAAYYASPAGRGSFWTLPHNWLDQDCFDEPDEAWLDRDAKPVVKNAVQRALEREKARESA